MKRQRILIGILLVCAMLLCSCGGTGTDPAAAETQPAGHSSAETQSAVSSKTADSGQTEKDQTQNPSPSSEKPAVSVSPSPTAAPKITVRPEKPAPAATAAPTRTPAPKSSLHDLEQQLKAMLKGWEGTWSIYCKRLDTDESFCINDTSLISASLIKLYVFGAVMEAVENGDLYFEDYSEPLELMIEYSDNDSCNILIDAAGGFEAVNDFIDRQGFKDTELYRYMLGDRSIENYTSAKECGMLLEQVLDGKFVSEETSGLLLYHLQRQYYLNKIPAGVPEGIETANKTGELENAENDAAIVWSPACTYILCIMSNDLTPYDNDGISQVCEISKTVYNYLNDPPAKSAE